MTKVRGPKVRRKKGSLLLRLLGLLGAALGAAWLIKKRPLSGGRVSPVEALPEGAEAREEGGLQGLPEDAITSWIPGPGGSLRICECNRQGALTVLFVHGLGGRLEQWAATLRALGPMYRGVALDLSGHGDSDPATAGYSVADLAADVAAVADGLRLRRFVLVGHSLGAMVAIEYAGAHRDRVSGLFLVDPSGDQSRLPGAEIEEFLATMRQNPRAEIRWYFQQLLSGSNEEVAAQVLADLDATAEDVLMATIESAAIYSPMPALEHYGGSVGCAASELNSLPNSLPTLLPELPVQRLAGTGHWIMLDRPATLQTILDTFLADLRDRLRPATVH